MYNKYIYEKQLKEKEIEKKNIEKIKKIKRIRLKKRKELAKKYYEKVNNFMYNMIEKPVIVNNSNNQLHLKKNNEDEKVSTFQSSDMTIPINKKEIIEKKINLFNKNNIKSLSNDNRKKREKTFYSNNDLIIMKNSNDKKIVHTFNQPTMRFKAKNDSERILDAIYLNRGKYVDNYAIIKINKRYNKKSLKMIKNSEEFQYKNNEKKNKNSTNNILINYTHNKNNCLLSLNNNEETLNKTKKVIENFSPKNKILEYKKNKKYFSNKIINSKLIKNITEKYHSKTFFQGLEFSLLNINNNNLKKTGFNFKKNKQNTNNISEYSEYYYNNYFTLKNKKNEIDTSLNFYYNDVKRFHKSIQRLIYENALGDSLDQSSDSSINDNGQEEIFKKVLELNHPILGESERKIKIKNNSLNHIKKLNLLKQLSARNNIKNRYSLKKNYIILKLKIINLLMMKIKRK